MMTIAAMALRETKMMMTVARVTLTMMTISAVAPRAMTTMVTRQRR